MGVGGYARRVDDNQTEIVTTLRQLGASVYILSRVGHGCLDLLVGMFGVTTIAEVKDGNKPLSAQKLTKAEQKFIDSWKGDYYILRNRDDAIKLVDRMRNLSNGRQQMLPSPHSSRGN